MAYQPYTKKTAKWYYRSSIISGKIFICKRCDLDFSFNDLIQRDITGKL